MFEDHHTCELVLQPELGEPNRNLVKEAAQSNPEAGVSAQELDPKVGVHLKRVPHSHTAKVEFHYKYMTWKQLWLFRCKIFKTDTDTNIW